MHSPTTTSPEKAFLTDDTLMACLPEGARCSRSCCRASPKKWSRKALAPATLPIKFFGSTMAFICATLPANCLGWLLVAQCWKEACDAGCFNFETFDCWSAVLYWSLLWIGLEAA